MDLNHSNGACLPLSHYYPHIVPTVIPQPSLSRDLSIVNCALLDLNCVWRKKKYIGIINVTVTASLEKNYENLYICGKDVWSVCPHVNCFI